MKQMKREAHLRKIINDAESNDYLMCIKSYNGVHAIYPKNSGVKFKIVPHRYVAGKAYRRSSIYYKEGHWRLPIKRA
jgi:hypothetical protein